MMVTIGRGDHPRNSQLLFPLQLHAGGSSLRLNEGPCVMLLHKIGLCQIFSCILPDPPGFTIIGTHILLKKVNRKVQEEPQAEVAAKP